MKVATGYVIGRCDRRHRRQEFLKFLKEIDAQVVGKPGVQIHIIMDNNNGTHQAPSVERWFERHPEHRQHITSTSGSWLNQVKRFFDEIREKAVLDYLSSQNEAPSRSRGPPTRSNHSDDGSLGPWREVGPPRCREPEEDRPQ